MKKTGIVILALLMLSFVPMALAIEINTITEGEVLYSAGHYLAGEPIPLGFDDWGYNYQGHMYKGTYFNSYAGGAGFAPYLGEEGDTEYELAYLAENVGASSHWTYPYRFVKLAMKWNDAWLSNVDADLDGKLDRHFGLPSYIGSGAWLTNHQSGEYEQDEEIIQWNYFVKIVAQQYVGQAVEIGAEPIWGEFMIIQQVSNDAGLGEHRLLVKFDPCGFGCYPAV